MPLIACVVQLDPLALLVHFADSPLIQDPCRLLVIVPTANHAGFITDFVRHDRRFFSSNARNSFLIRCFSCSHDFSFGCKASRSTLSSLFVTCLSTFWR